MPLRARARCRWLRRRDLQCDHLATLFAPSTTANSAPAVAAQLATRVKRQVVRWSWLSYLLFAVLILAPYWRHPYSRAAGVHGDWAQFVWFLSYTRWALLHAHSIFFTHQIQPPGGVNLMWNTSMPLAGAVLLPVTVLAGPQVSYLVLITACFVLSAVAAQRLATRLVDSSWLSWSAGALYGFSPYEVAHNLGHPNLALAFYPPLLVMLLIDRARHRRGVLATGLLVGTLTAAQILLGEEVLADTWFVYGLVGGLMILLWRRDTLRLARDVAPTLMVAVGVVCMLDFYPLLVQFLGPQRMQAPLHPSASISGIDLLNLVVPSRATWLPGLLAPTALRVPEILESTGYLGLLPPLAVVGWAAQRRRHIAQWLCLSVITAGVLEVGARAVAGGSDLTASVLPWRLVEKLPVAGDLLPTRLSLQLTLPLVMLAVLGAQALLRHAGTGQRAACASRAIAVTLLVAALVAFLPRLPYPAARHAHAPEFFTSTLVQQLPPACLVVSLPIASSELDDEAMLWQAVSDFRFRLYAGYAMAPRSPGQANQFQPAPNPLTDYLLVAQAADLPTGTPGLMAIPSRSADLAAPTGAVPRGEGTPALGAAQRYARGIGVCAYAVASPTDFPRSVAALDRLTGRQPRFTGGVDLWRADTPPAINLLPLK